MKSFWIKYVKCIVCICTVLLTFLLASASEEDDKLFGASLDLGYVSPNVWAGWQLSYGPCIHPTASFSIWEFNLGVFLNMYGSQRDKFKESLDTLNVDSKSQKQFGMIDEVQFFLDWGHSWDWFSLGASYWHLAYTWRYAQHQDTTQKVGCEWFGKYSSGELTVSPSFNFGPFSIFTDQSVVIVAQARDETDDPLNLVSKKNDIGSYHGVLGLSWSQAAGERGEDLQCRSNADYLRVYRR